MQHDNVTTIYLARHGQTHSNLNEVMDGQGLNALLTEQGEAQAAELAQSLKGVHFDAAFSSDLVRAHRTAQIALLDRELAVNTTELLRERHWGEYEGIPVADYKERNKVIIASLNELSQEEQWKHVLGEGVETLDQVYERFMRFIREVAITYTGKTILLVSHGGLMRTTLHHIGWADHITLPSGSIENAAYVAFKTDGLEFEVIETKGVNKQEHV